MLKRANPLPFTFKVLKSPSENKKNRQHLIRPILKSKLPIYPKRICANLFCIPYKQIKLIWGYVRSSQIFYCTSIPIDHSL